MESKPTILLVAVVITMTTGCITSSHKYYEGMLDEWIGLHQDKLLTAWGPPDKEGQLSDGSRILSYQKESTYAKPENPGEGGLAHALGYKLGENLGEKLWGAKQPPGCKTMFLLNKDLIITSYKSEGEDCRISQSGAKRLAPH